MVERGLGAPAHDHLGGRDPPDRRLIAGSPEGDLGACLPHDPAGLVAPVVPGATHREEPLVPDHLGDYLEADPLEAQGDLCGMHACVPDVPNLEGGDEGERLAPVDAGVARERGVAMAPAPPTGATGRACGAVSVRVA